MTVPEPISQTDAPEARVYNLTSRWLEIGDLVVSFGLLAVLLATTWTGSLRAPAARMAREHYARQLFYYFLFLTVITQAVGGASDFYRLLLERRFLLSPGRRSSS